MLWKESSSWKEQTRKIGKEWSWIQPSMSEGKLVRGKIERERGKNKKFSLRMPPGDLKTVNYP